VGAIETELVVKIASGGSGQTVRDVLGVQKAIAQLGKDAKDTANLAKALGTAFNLPDDQVRDLADALGQAKNETEALTKEAKGLNSVFQGIFQGVGQQATQVAVEAVQALGQAVQDTAAKALEASSQYNAAIGAINTLGVDGAALGQNLQGVADGLGNQASSIELLQGSYDVVSSGFTEVADVAAIAEASVKGAAGGFSDFATVSDATTSILNAYGQSAQDAGDIVDKLIATQNAGKITVGQYAEQIGKLAPTAKLAGIGLDELNGFIATATVAGVPVEATFAGLRQAIGSTLKPTAEATAKAKELKIEFNAAALKTKGLSGILAELNAKGADTADNLFQLFGSVEAVAAISPSAGAGLANLTKNIDASKNAAGSADAAFKEISATIPGLQTALKNQLSEGFLGLGKAIEPVRSGVLAFASDLLTATVDGSDGLGALSEAGERLRVVLSENPEIAERLGEALATVADAAISQFAQIIDAVTAFVSNEGNIEQIAGQIESLAEIITKAGQAARFLIALADGIGQLQTAAEGLPIIGDNIDRFTKFPTPIGLATEAIRGLIEVFDLLAQIVVRSVDGALSEIEKFAPALKLIIDPIQAILSQIKKPDPVAIEGVGIAASGSGKALEKLGTSLGTLQQQLKATTPTPAPGPAPEEVEESESRLKGLADANKTALDKIATDSANAKATLLESGGTQEQLLAAERTALQKRVDQNKTFLNQLKALQGKGGLSAEDAAAVADQIRGVEGQLASDRVSLAQQTLAEKKRIEKEAAEAAQKAAEAKAKAETDALKKQRDEEKRVAEQRQADAEKAAQREFDDARDGRSEARDAQRRAEDKALQEELQADDRAFQNQRRESDKIAQEQAQAKADAFQKSQQAEAEAFQRQLDAERDKGNREFDVLTGEVERRIQLEQAADAEARRALQEQFKLEDQQLERRKQVEAEVLAQRGQVLSENQGALELSPLEAARAAFEEQLQAKQKAFQEQQQTAAQAFQESQAAEAEARSEAQRLEDEARSDDRADAEEARAEARRLADKAFEESERGIQDAFEAQQRSQKEAFNAQQRQLDEASAARIAGILAAAKPAGIDGARRDGGPVKAGGSYLVGEAGPEIVTMRRGGYVHTARETAAMLSGVPVRGGVTVAQPSTGKLESQMAELLKEVKKGRTVQAGPTSFVLQSDAPVQDAVSIQLEQLRQMVRGGGL
jgi:TP901 family phage tail tape measure protein